MEEFKGLFILLAFFAFFYPMVATHYRQSCSIECKRESNHWLIGAAVFGLIGLAL